MKDTLLTSEEKYQELFHSIEEGFCIIEMRFDNDGKPVDYRFMETNPAFKSITGFYEAEGKWMKTLVPELEENWFELFGRVALTGEPVHFMDRADICDRWFDVYANKLGGEDSRTVAVLLKDITEQVQAECEMKRHNKVIEGAYSIFRSAYECRSELELKRTFLAVAEKAIDSQLSFIGEVNALGQLDSIATCHHGLDANRTKGDFGPYQLSEDSKIHMLCERIISGGKPLLIHGPGIHLTSTCGDLPVDAFLGVPLLEQGRPVGILAVANCVNGYDEADLTALQTLSESMMQVLMWWRAENALQKAFKELEQKVKERTSELAQLNTRLQVEINERKRTEKALLESEERYRSLVLNASESIVVVQDNIIKFANPMTEKIFSYPLEQLTFTPFIKFIHPEDKDLILERLKKSLNGEEVENPFTFRIMSGDGNIRLISKSSDLIEWEERPAILGLMTDITEAKKMEEEMLKADKLDSIGILAGGIAHDFNNYLATLQGNISLAKLYKHDITKVMDKLNNMEVITMRAKDLSNKLFTFAKGGAPVKEKISIEQLIFDDIKFTLCGSKIRPVFYIAEDLHMIEADKGQMSQVLNNIAINALHAMPEGGTLEIKAENITLDESVLSAVPLKAGDYVKISIKDQGLGIPEKYLSKIFDPFFTTKDNGHGLGLSTAYSIIKNHYGHLQVESERGVGTTFFIFLPAIPKVEVIQDADGDVFKGKGKILVMDDEEELLTVTGETLSALGYEVVLARDGREAIEQYIYSLNNEYPFDLVIMDLTIPGGLGGKETIGKLLKRDPEIKAVVASGYSNDPVMANFQDYGFKGMIKKPFTVEDLSKLIYETIG